MIDEPYPVYPPETSKISSDFLAINYGIYVAGIFSSEATDTKSIKRLFKEGLQRLIIDLNAFLLRRIPTIHPILFLWFEQVHSLLLVS